MIDEERFKKEFKEALNWSESVYTESEEELELILKYHPAQTKEDDVLRWLRKTIKKRGVYIDSSPSLIFKFLTYSESEPYDSIVAVWNKIKFTKKNDNFSVFRIKRGENYLYIGAHREEEVREFFGVDEIKEIPDLYTSRFLEIIEEI